jgi:hypothetical protein
VLGDFDPVDLGQRRVHEVHEGVDLSVQPFSSSFFVGGVELSSDELDGEYRRIANLRGILGETFARTYPRW